MGNYKGKRILLVEDDPMISEPTLNSLKRWEFIVSRHVTTGEDAVEEAKNNPPDLVLMDVVLAGNMTGIEAGEYITAELKLPVVYITGHADKISTLQNNGMEPVIKPFKVEDLKSAIEVAFYRESMKDKL